MSAADDVVIAWLAPGPVPRLHAQAQEHLRLNWPTLAKAVERLVDEHLKRMMDES